MTYFESKSHNSSSDPRRRLSRRVSAVRAGLAAAILLGGALLIAAGASANASSSAPGAFTTKGAWNFLSAPGLHPPILKVHAHHSGVAPGYFLVANLPNEGIRGPMIGEGGPIIYDSKLRPVWVMGVGTRLAAADLKQETYNGKPVLLWWQGNVNTQGIATKGELVIVNEQYHRIRTLKAHSPWVIALQDASISGNDIWVTVERQLSGQNLKRYGGASKGTISDAGIQEYDLRTGKQVGATWDALKHVSLKDSHQPPPSTKQAKSGASWDAYHLNSVQPLSGGTLLVSMRNTWAVYLVSPSSGKTIWTLGGKHSTFSFAKSARFAWQHHAELLGSAPTGIGTGVEMSLFNDDCTFITRVACQGPSEGMILRLNTVTHKATLVRAYRHHPAFKAQFLGSMQALPGGNALVGWGSPYSYFTEFSQSGKELLDVQWPGKDQSYRALYTQSWVGMPGYVPSGAARTVKGKTTVYASWNGATQVAKWQVLGGPSGHLKVVATHSRSGFQTVIALKKSYPTYEVQALDGKGHVLPHGTSKAFTAK